MSSKIKQYFVTTAPLFIMGQLPCNMKYDSAVQTPVLSPPAKKTPAPAENFRLVQICQNWKFLQFKLETPS